MKFFYFKKTTVCLLAVFVSVAAESGYAKTCPGKNMPNNINAIYVKYKITDELEFKNQKITGAPSNVHGDELAELIIWKRYRWERLYGKYWYVDMDAYDKQMSSYQNKMSFYLQQQLAGKDVTIQVNKLSDKILRYVPKSKIYDYDRISVTTPSYGLEYNRSNKMGYGHFGTDLHPSERNKLNPNVASQVDAFIANSFRQSNQIFGFKKLSSKQSSVLNIPCTREVIKTSFSDIERDYNQIEYCTAVIGGQEVDLFTQMGNPGERYIMQAVEVNMAYATKKDVFCSPSYVTVK